MSEHTVKRAGAVGFTLVEIVITLALLGVGLLAIAGVIPLGVRKNISAGQQSRASELVAARAEQILNTSYSEPELSAGTHDDPANPYTGHYYVRWTVEDDVPVKACKKITIRVNCPTVNAAATAQVVIVLSEAGS